MSDGKNVRIKTRIRLQSFTRRSNLTIRCASGFILAQCRLQRESHLPFKHGLQLPHDSTALFTAASSVYLHYRAFVQGRSFVLRLVWTAGKPQPFLANASRFSAKPSPADPHWFLSR